MLKLAVHSFLTKYVGCDSKSLKKSDCEHITINSEKNIFICNFLYLDEDCILYIWSHDILKMVSNLFTLDFNTTQNYVEEWFFSTHLKSKNKTIKNYLV